MDEPRFEPLKADSPLVEKECVLCNMPLKIGDIPHLIGDAPADEEEYEKMRQGRPYTAIADIVHYNCYRAIEYYRGNR